MVDASKEIIESGLLGAITILSLGVAYYFMKARETLRKEQNEIIAAKDLQLLALQNKRLEDVVANNDKYQLLAAELSKMLQTVVHVIRKEDPNV